jgi:tetratricopeptide (TPR) repeat protein
MRVVGDVKLQSQAEKVAKAEEFKNLGNQQLSSHQHQEAIDNYTKAIEYDPTNAIYYANRYVICHFAVSLLFFLCSINYFF